MTLCLLLGSCSSPAPNASQPQAAKVDPPHILQFYISPAEVASGENSNLCYGVENASAVRVTPLSDHLPPLFSHCEQISPAHTTQYELFVQGKNGQELRQTATLTVGPRRVHAASGAQGSGAQGSGMIRLFTASPTQVAPGAQATICYSVKGADTMELQPNSSGLLPNGTGCVTVQPSQTTTYTLTAKAAGGNSESSRVTLSVR